jgi:uncharacterized protein (UPF0332 family)
MARLSLDLLAQARVLARREPRRPKQASVRRSISGAYYALFHFLGEEATKLIVGTAHNRTALRQFAGRALVHAKMKNVCEEFIKGTPKSDLLKPFWPALHVAASGDIKTVSEAFINLQDLRHAADYDLTQSFTRQDAEEAAGQAKDAMEAWDRSKQRTSSWRYSSPSRLCSGRGLLEDSPVAAQAPPHGVEFRTNRRLSCPPRIHPAA